MDVVNGLLSDIYETRFFHMNRRSLLYVETTDGNWPCNSPKRDFWWIGFDVACNVSSLHFGHTVNFDPLGLTHWRNCKKT